ncbi:hypothetical protein G6F68_010150 [Rhizopus microsporus]|nr:hypothetical protein G6F68_010150 [Rhizopus microsporus]
MINDFASFDRKESFGFVFGSAAHTALYPKDSKKYCNFHKTTNHSDDECHAVKKASSSSGSTRVDISSSSTTCQWNSRNLPSGRSTGSSVDDSAFAGSSHMFREMSRTSASSLSSVASSDNGTPVSIGSSANPTAGSSDVSFDCKTDAAGPVVPVSNSSDDMGTDVVEASTVTEVAQTCKYIIHHIFSKVPSNTIMLYVPIIIEHIKTWAMIDTDSSFSCASPSFCSALGLIPMHNQGSIKLGHNSSSTVQQD